jgi:hypothetical protein
MLAKYTTFEPIGRIVLKRNTRCANAPRAALNSIA